MNTEHRIMPRRGTSNSPEASKHLSASGRSNTVFCQFKKILSNKRRRRLRYASESTLRNFVRRRIILRIACFKIDKALRHQYWTFEVGRSMFDVQSVHCSDYVKFNMGMNKQTTSARNLLLKPMNKTN
jgi:hypothetical protein